MSELAMAFDFGTLRIGIAIGQKITGTATPVGVIKAKNGIPAWQVVDQLVNEWKPTVFIVGLPINMDGSESEMSESAKKFGRRLHGRYGISVEMMDERLSTFEAREFENRQSQKKEQLDAIAAKLILETWLANQPDKPLDL